MTKNLLIADTMEESNENNNSDSNKAVPLLELNNKDAKDFLLKSESYCTFLMPPYFKFDKLLSEVDRLIIEKGGEWEKEFNHKKARENADVNYLLLHNKDGKYAWRPFALINPAIYVSTVHAITKNKNWKKIQKRFKCFRKDERIECVSIPVMTSSKNSDHAEQVSNWWTALEQQSIELAIEYEYTLHTDIADCYSSIYTHSIAWALHTKKAAKKRRRDQTLIGNAIDSFMQDMNSGQTNGIPQGSVLTDFIAEMVLGYVDLQLHKKLHEANIENFKILRYRDDYRIFVNNPQDGAQILKLLSEIIIDSGMSLSTSKTIVSDNVISSSIKPDKLMWMKIAPLKSNLEKYLLTIYSHAKEYPNSGSLNRALFDFYKCLEDARVKQITKEIIKPLISISVDIAFNNPRTYPLIATILSYLIQQLSDNEERRDICEKIDKKFQKIPNTGHLQIWLQRATIDYDRGINLTERLCHLVNGKNRKIWNMNWLSKDSRRLIGANSIIDKDELNNCKKRIPIPSEEIELFHESYY